MHCNDNKHTNKTTSVALAFVTGTLIGAAAGAAIGMILAPQKGSVLRRTLRRKGEDIVQEIAETVEARVERLTGIVSQRIEILKDELISKVGAIKG